MNIPVVGLKCILGSVTHQLNLMDTIRYSSLSSYTTKWFIRGRRRGKAMTVFILDLLLVHGHVIINRSPIDRLLK